MTNVENLWIQDTVHESINASAITGLTSLEQTGGTTIAAGTITNTMGAGQSLTLANMTDGNDAADGANQGAITIAAASAAVTSQALKLNGVGAQAAATVSNDLDLDLSGTGIATLSVTATGTNNISLSNTGGALANVTVAGAGSLVVWGTTATTITSFDASAATGAVTVDLSASTGANQTIKGGSAGDTFTADLARNITLDAGAGNDTVTLANPTAANLSSTTGAADSIKGGDGTDTLVVTAAGAAAIAGDAAADRAVITGFEVLRASSDLNGQAFDISTLGINHLQVNAATTTAAATVSGFTSGATVEYRAAADSTGATGQLNIGMTGATNAGTPDDLLNVKLNSDLVAQTVAADAFEFRVGVSGINKLVVTTADRDNTDGATNRDDGYILTLANDNNLTSITASGAAELSFTSTASTAALATVNATDLSGDLILNLATNGLTQGVTVTGGSGANTITGTGFGDVITGGSRADTITLGAGADTVTGGAGADIFIFTEATDFTAATAAALAGAADVITDFAKASDVIRLDTSTWSVVTNATAAVGTASINAEGIASFNAADDTLAEMITAVEAGINAGGVAAAGQFAIFTLGSDSYIFESNGTDGVDAGDMLIKLTGVTGLTDTTIATTSLTIA